MSNLQFEEKDLFEKIFKMDGGHLLDFSNARLQEFLDDYEINLNNNKYHKNGSSKAKRFRAFWAVEPDEVVAPILKGLLDYATLHNNLLPKDSEGALKVIKRLEEKKYINKSELTSEVEKNIIEKRIWGTGKVKVFLSHKSEYKNETAKLKEELSKHNIACFVAHEDVEPTREWQSEIENALFSMDILVALMTEEFQDSKWTDQEIGIALGRKKRVISVNLGTAPYGFVGKVQAISNGWNEIPIILVKKLLSLEPKMIDIFIDLMEICSSYTEGNKIAKYLEDITKLSNQQVERMVNIFNNNQAIEKSFAFNGSDKNSFGEGLAYHINRVLEEDIYQINLKSQWEAKIIKIK